MTRCYKILVAIAIAMAAIIVGFWYLVTDRSVAIGLSRLDVREDRVLGIEMYVSGGDGKIILPAEMVGEVLTSLRQDNFTDEGCKCGTSGLQILIHMRGEPDLAQISYTYCGGLVLHDGKGHTYSYFKNKNFIDLAVKNYRRKLGQQSGVAQPEQGADGKPMTPPFNLTPGSPH